MKHTWKVAVAAAALMGSASVAKADITLSGPTGLFLNPTAQIAPKDAPEAAVDYQRYSDNGYHANAIGIAGAIQLADKLELNGGFHHLGGDADFNQWNVGAKYRILSQSLKGIGVAVGADYSSFTDGGGHDFDVYAAATKDFNVNGRTPIQGTLGARYNDNDGGDSKVDVFAGVAVPLTRTGEFSLIGELGTARADYGDSEYALGVRYHPQGSAFNVGAGIARHTIFLQAGYQFGR